MKLIYVAGPLSKPCPIANLRNALRVADTIRDMGAVPYVPHRNLVTCQLLHPRSYEFWLAECKVMVERCDALFRMAGESPGTDQEEQWAKDAEKPVFWLLDGLRGWIENNR